MGRVWRHSSKRVRERQRQTKTEVETEAGREVETGREGSKKERAPGATGLLIEPDRSRSQKLLFLHSKKTFLKVFIVVK